MTLLYAKLRDPTRFIGKRRVHFLLTTDSELGILSPKQQYSPLHERMSRVNTFGNKHSVEGCVIGGFIP